MFVILTFACLYLPSTAPKRPPKLPGILDCEYPVQCYVNPCLFKNCGAHAKCVPNYCKGCHAECQPCPIWHIVNCYINPCDYTKCPIGRTCVSNYCGGCNADCKYILRRGK